jgi:P27 family predicted phage terminase small subunit
MSGQAIAPVVHLPSSPGAPSTSSRPPEREPVVLVAPPWLSPAGRRAFRNVALYLEADAPDWLAIVDADALGLAVEHLAVAVAASRAMRTSGGHYRIIEIDEAHRDRRRKHPAHQVFREATAAYLAVIRELGLTPRMRRELEVGLGYGGTSDDDDDPAGIFDA